jgi:periplasmic divalent cation tolerance protein
MAENHIVTLCTVPDRKTGETIAAALVEERLAACVNLVPGLSSTYRWKGKVEQAAECLLIIKTGVSRFDVLKRRIQELHPNELPEIIALPIIHGDRAYLDWITESTK